MRRRRPFYQRAPSRVAPLGVADPDRRLQVAISSGSATPPVVGGVAWAMIVALWALYGAEAGLLTQHERVSCGGCLRRPTPHSEGLTGRRHG